ncbi:hypothetical protein A1359_20055 [Methylomonas lenta]|uniref:Lipocalin-like domain-containing protein n=1 Tax=Methylomonas lenta TaxID=980561 RepID=A0A177NTM0_9GAMM|nr:hypothetical protein [Methylomonas lenta]OAI20894.1 hypothetical protein A1359_20055 [Methylomonas lenta]
MNKIYASLILLALSLWVPSIYADIALQSKDEVQGSWKLDHTKKSISSSEVIPREDTWNFKDGKVTILHIPREGVFYDQPPVNYEIVEGKLNVAILGRPDKFEVFSLLDKDDKNMTLKGKFGVLYFFVKK